MRRKASGRADCAPGWLAGWAVLEYYPGWIVMETWVKTPSFLAAMLASFIALAPAAFAQSVENSFDFKDFNRISVSGVYHLYVTVGEQYGVTVLGPASEMERVDVGLKGSTLRLGLRDRRFGERRVKNDGLQARITLPSLTGLHMSGVVDGEVYGIVGDSFDVTVSGVGEMRLYGECGRLRAEVSGVGGLDGAGLKCRDVRVVVSGVGKASVFASEAVDAVVSGMGDITVLGSPKQVKKSGGMFAEISIR